MDRESLARLLAESIMRHGWESMGVGHNSHWDDAGERYVDTGFEEVWIGGNHEAAPTNLLSVADDVLAALKEKS